MRLDHLLSKENLEIDRGKRETNSEVEVTLFNFEGPWEWNFKREEAAILETRHGGVAQLGEHLPCTQGVRSSILLISTSRFESDGTDRAEQGAREFNGRKGLERRMPMSNQKWAHSSGG